jgi:hypothetical protein
MANISITEALIKMGVDGFHIEGVPTTEQEFNSMFRKLVSVDENHNGTWSTNPNNFGVTWSQVVSKQAELQAEYDAKAYARSRSAEYPPITDYLDGVVKGDQAQIDAYIAACQAVKAKYPKV